MGIQRVGAAQAAWFVAATTAVLLSGCTTGSDGAAAESSSVAESTSVAEQVVDVVDEEVADGLEDFVAGEAATVPTLMEAFDGLYSEIEVLAEQPDTVHYSYTYAEAVDVDAATELFDAQIDSLQESCDSVIFPAMEAAGVTGSQAATYSFHNRDGSLIWEHTFTSA